MKSAVRVRQGGRLIPRGSLDGRALTDVVHAASMSGHSIREVGRRIGRASRSVCEHGPMFDDAANVDPQRDFWIVDQGDGWWDNEDGILAANILGQVEWRGSRFTLVRVSPPITWRGHPELRAPHLAGSGLQLISPMPSPTDRVLLAERLGARVMTGGVSAYPVDPGVLEDEPTLSDDDVWGGLGMKVSLHASPTKPGARSWGR